jgi:hypothetical protein
MKPNQKQSKLQLKKQAVSNLSNAELKNINGGGEEGAQWTTSIGKCTGFLCCGPSQTCTTSIIQTTITIITIL